MGFRFHESMIRDYRTRGCVIFRQILPPSLIRDLRRAAAKAHVYAREKRGPQAQRLQPIANYGIDMRPFHDYAEFPPLVDAVSRVLTPEHRIANSELKRMGLLLEPEDQPWCTRWHRDLRETSNVPDVEEFRRVNHDPLWFNQINCPLYEDNCTWVRAGKLPARRSARGDRRGRGSPASGRRTVRSTGTRVSGVYPGDAAFGAAVYGRGGFRALPSQWMAYRQLSARTQTGDHT